MNSVAMKRVWRIKPGFPALLYFPLVVSLERWLPAGGGGRAHRPTHAQQSAPGLGGPPHEQGTGLEVDRQRDLVPGPHPTPE